jgi:hypothetical protein
LEEESRAQDEARNRDFLRRSRQILLDEAKNPQYARTETEQVKAAIRELSATLNSRASSPPLEPLHQSLQQTSPTGVQRTLSNDTTTTELTDGEEEELLSPTAQMDKERWNNLRAKLHDMGRSIPRGLFQWMGGVHMEKGGQEGGAAAAAELTAVVDGMRDPEEKDKMRTILKPILSCMGSDESDALKLTGTVGESLLHHQERESELLLHHQERESELPIGSELEQGDDDIVDACAKWQGHFDASDHLDELLYSNIKSEEIRSSITQARLEMEALAQEIEDEHRTQKFIVAQLQAADGGQQGAMRALSFTAANPSNALKALPGVSITQIRQKMKHTILIKLMTPRQRRLSLQAYEAEREDQATEEREYLAARAQKRWHFLLHVLRRTQNLASCRRSSDFTVDATYVDAAGQTLQGGGGGRGVRGGGGGERTPKFETEDDARPVLEPSRPLLGVGAAAPRYPASFQYLAALREHEHHAYDAVDEQADHTSKVMLTVRDVMLTSDADGQSNSSNACAGRGSGSSVINLDAGMHGRRCVEEDFCAASRSVDIEDEILHDKIFQGKLSFPLGRRGRRDAQKGRLGSGGGVGGEVGEGGGVREGEKGRLSSAGGNGGRERRKF